MGVYIKGMEMPKDGVYWCEIGVADDIAMITIHGEDRKSFPLVPVQPHGRLVDADRLGFAMMDAANVDQALAMVDGAPTVLEAEGGET